MLKIVLIVGVLLFNLVGVQAHEKEMGTLDNLVKKFEANPADPHTTIQLLRELKNQGKPNRDVVNRYLDVYKRQGSDQINEGDNKTMTGDLNVNWSQEWGKHFVFTNIGYTLSENTFEEDIYNAEGFPNDKDVYKRQDL